MHVQPAAVKLVIALQRRLTQTIAAGSDVEKGLHVKGTCTKLHARIASVEQPIACSATLTHLCRGRLTDHTTGDVARERYRHWCDLLRLFIQDFFRPSSNDIGHFSLRAIISPRFAFPKHGVAGP